MKKIVKISLILLSALCMMTKVYAASASINLQTSKNEFDKNEQFVVEVTTSNLQAEGGIIAFGATLEYDKNHLTLVEMKGGNNWSDPTYNEANGKFVMDRKAVSTSDETIFTMTFKINEQSRDRVSITLKDISASNGGADIKIENVTKTITIKEVMPSTTPSDPVNLDENTNHDNNSNNNSHQSQNITTTATEKSNSGTKTNTNQQQNVTTNANNNVEKDNLKSGILPKAGTTNGILIALGIFIVLAVFFYRKMKKMDKNKS